MGRRTARGVGEAMGAKGRQPRPSPSQPMPAGPEAEPLGEAPQAAAPQPLNPPAPTHLWKRTSRAAAVLGSACSSGGSSACAGGRVGGGWMRRCRQQPRGVAVPGVGWGDEVAAPRPQEAERRLRGGGVSGLRGVESGV
jgi:hypothetical protein